MAAIRYRILGPLEVSNGRRWVAPTAPKQRLLLGVLLCHANRLMSSDRLQDELWGERLPATSRQLLHGYVFALRRLLADPGGDRLATRPSGYQLVAEPGELDADCFTELVQHGRRALREHSFEAAADRFGSALALWRGSVLADVAAGQSTDAERTRLEDGRLAAAEGLLQAELACGRHREVLAQAAVLGAEFPLQEEIHRYLMLALYRSGRQAEALETYRSLRRRLVDELGIEPSPPLQGLQRQILAADEALQAPAGARVLLRSTVTYSTVLWTGFHPDLLRDALERDRHFDYLWRQVTRTPALAACIPAERRDLWRGDIPYFATRTDGTQLRDSDGGPVPGIRFVPGIERVRRRLAKWDDDHLHGQLRLVRASLAAAAINASDELVFPEYQLPDAGRKATAGELVAAARAIGDELARLAYGDRDSAQWLGLTSERGRNWSYGPIGPDLFNGLTGVALFLAELGRLTGEPRHTDLARRAVTTACQQLDREVLAGVGGMAGLPGVAYALCRLAPLLADRTLVDRAAAVTAALVAAAAQDTEYDVVAGSAGTIAGLRLLHRLRPDGPAAGVIAVAADRLAASGEPFAAGRGWVPDSLRQVGWSEVPLAGLGHGTAGVAWGLLEAARCLGDRRYAELARAALAYERSLFDPAERAWRDLRIPIRDRYRACAWCHGAVGIGLARLASRELLAGDPELDGEVAAALDTARRRGFGSSHSLCHGDLGSVELLLTAARVLGRPDLRAEAEHRTADVLASIRTGGWICGVPLGTPTPSLLVGLSGIGYQLLRVAAPDTVPSVLTMEPG